MSNVINIKIISGIPGCGKTTWSREYVSETRNVIRINRDDLRHILVEDYYSEGNENIINRSKLSLIKVAIESDRNIVLDDTHCYKDYLIYLIDKIRQMSIELNKKIEIEILDFDVPVDICVHRNSKRSNSIPSTAIYQMINKKREIDFTELDIDKYTKMN